MEINLTEKLKSDLKKACNSESKPGCPMQSIDHEYNLINPNLAHNSRKFLVKNVSPLIVSSLAELTLIAS